MTLDEAIRHAEEVAEYDCYNDEQKKCADEHRQLAEWLRELKRLRESATDADTISRRDAIKTSLEFFVEFLGGAFHENEQKELIARFQRLPSADRPSGHWVLINRGLDIYMCDRCGEILQIDSVPIWDYCPVCGARMGGETDGRPNK